MKVFGPACKCERAMMGETRRKGVNRGTKLRGIEYSLTKGKEEGYVSEGIYT